MKDKKEKMDKKNRKRRGGKIFLCIVGVLLVIGICDVCITEYYAKKLPHRFATAEEGKQLMLANTEFYEGFTQNDIDFRLRKSGGTLDELKEASANEVKSFSFIDKYAVDRRIAKMVRTISKNGYDLPETDEIVFIKTDMNVEMGAGGYTHGTQIYLCSVNLLISYIPGKAGEFFGEMIWHEYFHCLTRNNPDFRSHMYSLINFTVGEEYELPACVRDKCLSNPDVEHHDAYATFIIDGEEVDCFTAWITTKDYAEAQGSANEAVALIPIDGSDTYYLSDQASNFDEIYGTNTDYTIDPEECMADNFAYAMYYGTDGPDGQGYPNPEIIQGIIDYVSE